jgi:hypothetical protein
MLDVRRAPWFDEELLCGGVWSRQQLLEMNAAFTGAVERAFACKAESRASAAASVRVRHVTEEWAVERAISAAWAFFQREERDVPFATVLAFARIRYSRITAETLRDGFERRRRSPGMSSA